MTLEEIKDIVYNATGRRVDKDTRQWHYAYARKMFCQLASTYTSHSLKDIGDSCGITHPSVLYALNTFDSTVMAVESQRDAYKECLSSIGVEDNGVNSMRNENRQLRRLIEDMKLTSRDKLDSDTERLFALYNALPDRLREDVMFKVETAYKINEKHKRDLNVIYTEA
jgi:hypothetical protein